MEAAGGTATFDGIIVAVKMLMEEKVKNPDAKLMLFVLSDGETNSGHSLNEIEEILKVLKIPVYTIGYNANIKKPKMFINGITLTVVLTLNLCEKKENIKSTKSCVVKFITTRSPKSE